MRKLKSIKQLLEEFPCARFTRGGNIICDTWSHIIGTECFQYFGEEISDSTISKYQWDEQWFEPIKEKKLYAYTDTYNNRVLFFKNESKDPAFDRCPEFDLVFKD